MGLDAKNLEGARLAVQILSATKKDQRALEAADRVVTLAPQDPDAHRVRGDCLVVLMRPAEAALAFEKVIHYRPDDADAWLALGRSFRQVRKPAMARMALTKAIALGGDRQHAERRRSGERGPREAAAGVRLARPGSRGAVSHPPARCGRMGPSSPPTRELTHVRSPPHDWPLDRRQELVLGSPRSQEVFNPATGVAEKRVLLADKATVQAAIASAEKAYPAWRATPPLKRARVMSKLKNLLEMHAEKIAGAAHRRARQGRRRRDGRGPARHRERRVRLVRPRAPQGRAHAATSARASTRGASSSRSA